MNGLCAGLGLIGAWCFGSSRPARASSWWPRPAFYRGRAGRFSARIIFPRPALFWATPGSHLTGYLMAVLAILPHFYTAQTSAEVGGADAFAGAGGPAGRPGLGGVAALENGPAVLCRRHQPSCRTAWTRRGLSRTQAVLLIWLLAAALGALAFFGNNLGGGGRVRAGGNGFRKRGQRLGARHASRSGGPPRNY